MARVQSDGPRLRRAGPGFHALCAAAQISIAILADEVRQVCKLRHRSRLYERNMTVRDIIAIGGSLGGLEAL